MIYIKFIIYIYINLISNYNTILIYNYYNYDYNKFKLHIYILIIILYSIYIFNFKRSIKSNVARTTFALYVTLIYENNFNQDYKRRAQRRWVYLRHRKGRYFEGYSKVTRRTVVGRALVVVSLPAISRLACHSGTID